MSKPTAKSPFPSSFPFRPSWNFIYYAVIGISGVTLDYGSYAVLLNVFGWNYLVANILSTSIGITNNFILNAFLNFKVRDRLIRRFLLFYGIGIIGLGLSTLLLWQEVERFGIPPLIAKLVTIIAIVMLQYNLNRRISFRRHQHQI